MQFRQQALSKAQSAEDIDLPVRYARPQGWLALAVTLVVMAAAAVWSVTGTVSSTLAAPGILTHGQGSYVLQSPVAGQVTAVLAKEGSTLRAGAPLLKIRTPRGSSVVRTLAAGRLTTLVASIGSVLTTGADVASIERVRHSRDPLTATLYVPAGRAASVPVGAPVDLGVQSAPTQTYGVLRGHVRAVGRTAQSRQQIGSHLGSDQLGEEFSKDGPPVAVLVRLDRSTATRSGYRWSSPKGPPFTLDSMTLATGTVHLADRHPIEWLLP
ncbi:HlyD family efflux transporter periplasmic adaptor subunit [Streptomyces sp. NA02950]|uniref:HlyD family efflux transporter periplasmic adaptor subunit n=1 Tax=Streptomyces sp. NA02950 TaxID=2742137 RepID=UPI0015915199|nr:HlyD family efflux transporter periplasmic adaptor subunit [Streptomyces sp. NA02950]QKV96487.1 HlyD family efflux transporter periplasmic adaptor subunit [Streptomyces sp. NA02950]